MQLLLKRARNLAEKVQFIGKAGPLPGLRAGRCTPKDPARQRVKFLSPYLARRPGRVRTGLGQLDRGCYSGQKIVPPAREKIGVRNIAVTACVARTLGFLLVQPFFVLPAVSFHQKGRSCLIIVG